MSEAKFTEGEWVAGRHDMATYVDGYPSKWIYAGDKYCAIASGSDIRDWEEVMSNAHLIAAAPEMYYKLEKVAEFFEILNEDDAANEIKALLAKARGEL